MIILGIETSCDETAAALLKVSPRLRSGNINVDVLSNVVSSQIKIHAKTGGVVPEVAARKHFEKIIPVIKEALAPLNNPPHPNPLLLRRGKHKIVDAIAVTYGPGLITSLSIGVEAARILSWAWKVPLVAVNHLEGHIAAAQLRQSQKSKVKSQKYSTSYQLQAISYPALALVVSGGHSELVLMQKKGSYKIIGATRDDAVGEAFDKVAKILGLGYPGGPIVSRLAEQGDPTKFPFKPPMINSGDYDFSFSGIKTAVLYKAQELTKNSSFWRPTGGQNPDPGQARMTTKICNDLCASFQKSVVDVLVYKTIRAAKEFNAKTIILAGGVAANKCLRDTLATTIQNQLPALPAGKPVTDYRLPVTSLCTDNAVMIATAGYFHAIKKQFTPWNKLDVDSNLSFNLN